MNANNLPAATGGSLELLLQLLHDRGVAVRVNAGEIQVRDPARRLHAVDKGVLLHYEADLVAYITRGCCPHCGDVLHDNRVVYRTDARDQLQERCIGCGCTWLWGDPGSVVLPGRPHDTEIASVTEATI